LRRQRMHHRTAWYRLPSLRSARRRFPTSAWRPSMFSTRKPAERSASNLPGAAVAAAEAAAAAGPAAAAGAAAAAAADAAADAEAAAAAPVPSAAQSAAAPAACRGALASSARLRALRSR
jgi:hypothetical protein